MNPSSSLLVLFAVSGWVLALPATAVGELVHEPALVRPPQSPGVVMGLFSLRGEVVPVVRPDVLLNVPPPPPGLFRVLIVMQGRDLARWALLVDRAIEIVPAGTLLPVPATHSLRDCVEFLLPRGDTDVPVLVPDRLLQRSEAVAVADFAERIRQRWEEFRLGDA